MLEMADVDAINLFKQDDDNTDCEITDRTSEYTGVPNLDPDIKEDNLDNQQEVLHLGEVCHNQKLQTSRVWLPPNVTSADTVIGPSPLQDLGNPAGPVRPLLLQ